MIDIIDKDSIFYENITRGIDNKLICFSEDGNKIIYNCSRTYSTSFKNPEEKVRASYFVELVLDYQYPKEKIDIEVKVERRTPDDRADIVVYEDEELKAPYLIVETKKDGISDSEFTQAIEQAFGNANSKRAQYAIVVAGNTKTAFNVAGFNSSEREKNVIADIPIKYGKAPKYKFTKGDKSKDLKIAYREDLISALKKSHSSVWQGGKLAPTTAFDEVSKLLFCKLKDEKKTKKNEHYKFQIGSHETPNEVADRVQKIYEQAKTDDPQVFKERINLSSEIIYNVVEHLQGLTLSKTDLDTKGVAFEIFMKDFFIGKMGQFFTPRPVVQFCVKMMEPKQSLRVIDPSCGSGGFLLYAMDEVRQYAEENYDDLEAFTHWHSFAEKKLFGIEINDQIARVCKMNMIIHDDGHTNVIGHDALDGLDKMQKLNSEFKENSFDLILSNPPFGATIKSKEVKYIKSFDLGKNGTSERKTQKSEILFIERCVQLAKKGTGKIAIVVPEGIMTNSSLQYVRDYILEHCELLASVSLPESAFSHFGAGIKSSLLFLRRKKDKEKLGDYTVFMAVAKQVGISSTGREEENELYSDKSESIYNQWKLYSKNKSIYKNTDNCYTIKLSEINKEGPLNAIRYIWKPTFKNKVGKITDIADIVSDKITPTSEDNEFSNFALIRMDELQNNPVRIDNVIYCLGSEIEGSLKIVKPGDILLARLGPSMLNRKIVVVPPIPQVVDYIVASPEFIVIRPKDLKDSFYITGVLRTDLMLKYMYSKTRGGTPSRYRLNEDDFKELDFPIVGDKARETKSTNFSKALTDYHKAIQDAEKKLLQSHTIIENDL
ncbi:N-6 DNA methylase [Sphingobacterium psychroaquaticum]|uniref:Type I restriction enzyme M protein n=1 Tax=Sphingobacterium psychroaquaticum TaxID=561061 RepID=A0A1X7IF39_9SPHI|nr:N-6 DNA methylase [Sphingobacterium psychroaquaticum]SMG12963.1 type I restriction enzyme M protein [Sphingobacterium psychroaquaticum]